MVNEAAGQYESQWAAIASIVARIGGTAETLRRWVRRKRYFLPTLPWLN
jgi:transposase-like protein